MKAYEPRSALEIAVARHSRPRTRRRLPLTGCLELSPSYLTAEHHRAHANCAATAQTDLPASRCQTV